MFGSIKRLYRPTTASMYDQAIQSGSNFLSLACLANVYPTAVIGEFILVISLMQIIIGLQRSVVVLPFITTQSTDQRLDSAGGWFIVNLIFVAASMTVLLLMWVAAFFLESAAIHPQTIALASMLTPSLACYEFCRRWMYQTGRYPVASGIATLLGVMYLAGVVLSMATGYGISIAIAGYAAGGIAAVAITTWCYRREICDVSVALEEWLGLRRSIGWHLLSSVAHLSYTSAMPFMVALAGNQSMVAIFGATRAIVTPFLTAASALDSVEKPRASRAFASGGAPALWKSAISTGRILLAIAAPGLLLVLILGPWILGVAFGPAYRQHYPLLLVWSLSVILILLNQPVETCMIILQKTRELFLSKVVGCLLGMLAVFVLVPYVHSIGAVIAVVLAVFIALAMNFLTLRQFALLLRSESQFMSSQENAPVAQDIQSAG